MSRNRGVCPKPVNNSLKKDITTVRGRDGDFEMRGDICIEKILGLRYPDTLECLINGGFK